MNRGTAIWEEIKTGQANENASEATTSNGVAAPSASSVTGNRGTDIWEKIKSKGTTSAIAGAPTTPSTSPIIRKEPSTPSLSLYDQTLGLVVDDAMNKREAEKANETLSTIDSDIAKAREKVNLLRQQQDALYRNASPEAIAQRSVVESTLGKAQDELSALLRQQEEAQNTQSYYRYADMQGNEDFAEKSQFVQQALDPYDALNNRASLYDFVNDMNGARQKIASEYERGPSYLYGDWTPYAHLTEDEKGVFNYIHATEGEEAAKGYLDYLADTLTYRQGADIAERMKNAGSVSQALYGVTSGVNQFGSGVSRGVQRIFAETPNIDNTAVEYATSEIMKDLDENGKKGAAFAFQVAQIAGNMAPSILMGSAVGSILKAAGLGAKALNIARNAIFSGSISLSSGGNAYKTGIEQYGMNEAQAQMYANLVGASEGGLSYLLSGIGQGGTLVNKWLGGNGAAKFAAKVANIDNALARFALQFGGQLVPRMTGEVLEEEAQIFLEPAFRTILTGDDYDAPQINEIINTALLSMATSGLMSGPAAAGAAMQGGRPTPAPTQPTTPAGNAIDDLLAGIPEPTAPVAESAQNAVETPEILGGETVAENIETAQNATGEVKLSEDVAAEEAAADSIPKGASANYGSAENHIDNRSSADMGDRRIKAFQYDHPELHPYFYGMAQMAMVEVEATMEAGRGIVRGEHRDGRKKYTNEYQLVPPMVQALRDATGATMDEIHKALEDIMADRGSENYAVAKRVELALDDMLTNGFRTREGTFYEGMPAYIEEKSQIEGAETDWERYLRENSLSLADGSITEEQLRTEFETRQRQHAATAPEEQSVGAAPAGFEGDTVRSFNKNIATDMAREEALREESREAPEKYFRLANADVEAQARAIFDRGLVEAKSVLDGALAAAQNGGKLVPEMVPLAKLVADELTRQGDLYTANRIIADVAAELTAAGQLTQAAKILREASPSTVSDAVQKAFDKINEANGVNASAQEQEALIRALTESRDEALDRLRSIESEYERELRDLRQSRDDAQNILRTLHEEYRREYDGEEDIDERSWVQRLGASLAASISNRYSTEPAAPPPISRIILNDLVRFAENYALPSRPTPTRRSATDRITDFFNNRENYVAAWNIARRDVRERYSNNPAALDAFEEWLQGTMDYNASGTDAVMLRAITESVLAEELRGKQLDVRSQVDANALTEQIYNRLNSSVNATGSDAIILHRAVERFVGERALNSNLNHRMDIDIRNSMREIGVRMSEIIEQSPGRKLEVAERISNMLVREYGISQAEAGNVANMVVEQFNRMVAESSSRKLESIFRERSPRQQKSAREKFLKLANLGAFSDSTYSEQAMQKIFGIRPGEWQAEFTSEELEEIRTTDWTQEGAFEAFYTRVAQRLGREMPSSLWEKLVEIRRVAMLLNPKTQIKNFVANAPLMVMRKGSEVLSGAVQGALVQLGVMDSADRTRTAFYSKQSRDIARQLYEQNRDDLRNRSNRWDMNSLLREHRRYFGDSLLGQAADAARTFTYWLLEQGDSPYMRSAFIDSAARYIEAQGYTSLESVPQEVIDVAGQNALEATFKDASQLSEFINKIKRQGGAAGAALDILFPFTTTPINITKRMYEYSPAALAKFLSREFRQQDLTTKIDAVSKSTVGSVVIALGFFMAKLGWITGGADDDRDKAAWDKATGTSPYSFGGKVSYDWAQPAGSLLAIGAELAEVAKGDQSVLDAILNSVYTGGDAFLELSFFQNVLDLMKGYGSNTEQILTEITESGVSQMAPTLMGAIARTVDDTARTTYGADMTGNEMLDRTLAGFMSKTPGLSKLLPESVNVKGETTKRADTWWERALYEGIVPANVNVAGKTEVDQLIDDLFETTGNKNVFPNSAPKTVQGETETLTMTGAERAQYQRTMGQTYMELIGALLGEDGPDSLTPEQQAKATEYIKEYANAVAKEEFLESRGEDFESTTEGLAEIPDLADYFGVKAAFALAADTAHSRENFDPVAVEALLGDYNALSDESKAKLNDASTHSRLDDIAAANAAGVSVADWDKAYDEWKRLDEDATMKTSEKPDEFSYWLSKQNLTNRQQELLKEQLGYWGMNRYESGKLDALIDVVGNEDAAKRFDDKVDALKPPSGKTRVDDYDIYYLALNEFGSSRTQMEVIELYMQESTFGKMERAVNEGYTPKEFITFMDKKRTYTKKNELISWATSHGYTKAEAEWLYKLSEGTLK